MYEHVEEGTPCDQTGCNGEFEPTPPVNCSCHIAPPCSACTEAGYTCNTCGHDTAPHEEPEKYDTLA